jgi:hypothetical protein
LRINGLAFEALRFRSTTYRVIRPFDYMYFVQIYHFSRNALTCRVTNCIIIDIRSKFQKRH